MPGTCRCCDNPARVLAAAYWCATKIDYYGKSAVAVQNWCLILFLNNFVFVIIFNIFNGRGLSAKSLPKDQQRCSGQPGRSENENYPVNGNSNRRVPAADQTIGENASNKKRN